MRGIVIEPEIVSKPKDGKKRVVIEGVTPQLDAGRFAVKRIVGDTLTVEADVFGDGHDHVTARLLYRHHSETAWRSVRMKPLGNDRWRASFPLERLGRYIYTIAGAVDHFDTWRSDLIKRLEAGQDVHVDLQNGGLLLEHSARLAARQDAVRLNEAAQALRSRSDEEDTKVLALDPTILALVERYPDEAMETRYERQLEVIVDRERARFSSWYEMFPRSASDVPGRHGTFADCAARLDYVAELGFNVLYMPPIHPIGTSFRKGKNNSVTAEHGEEGSPWAIGNVDGGHTAIHSSLGTFKDFQALRAKAAKLGIELALDIAFQCAPDHPWVTEHPDWFRKRADGSIQYAENPPKKYQDIYPLDFESPDWEGLWEALKGVFLFWIEQGVKIFRVDNPHTKAFPFWEWAITAIKREHPDVLFLAEAFTRPRVMQRLAKLGFSQSYTYFTWRNTGQEIVEYLTELTQTPLREYFRPNFWPNTPDILPESLQIGGRPAFITRLVLAATLSSNYGIYGPAYEMQENLPMKQGGEEYLNSEKYEIRHWDLNAPESLRDVIAQVNQARRANPALQFMESLTFHPTDNPSLLCYSKASPDGSNVVLTVVNLDPVHTQAGWVALDLASLNLTDREPFQVYDQLADRRYLWQGSSNYIELIPDELPAHIFRILRRVRTEKDFDYYL